MNWERASIEAAAAYLREMIEAGADDYRTRSVYEGLLDVLDPSRYAVRTQQAAGANAPVHLPYGMPERRSRIERRGHADRRLINLGPTAGGERRSGVDRRSGQDRRNP